MRQPHTLHDYSNDLATAPQGFGRRVPRALLHCTPPRPPAHRGDRQVRPHPRPPARAGRDRPQHRAPASPTSPANSTCRRQAVHRVVHDLVRAADARAGALGRAAPRTHPATGRSGPRRSLVRPRLGTALVRATRGSLRNASSLQWLQGQGQRYRRQLPHRRPLERETQRRNAQAARRGSGKPSGTRSRIPPASPANPRQCRPSPRRAPAAAHGCAVRAAASR